MVEAMVFVLRTGAPWRDLPDHFGPWASVYTRWRRWCRSGLWPRLLELVGTLAGGQLRHLDATHIKVHQDASTGGQQEAQAMGMTKGGLNTKVTALVDGAGRALQLAAAPGQQAEVRAVEAIELPAGKRVVADKGYDSDAFRQSIRTRGSTPCIPPRQHRKDPVRWHRGWYRKRHQVENFFQRIKRLRRAATRYEKLALHFLGFLHLAAVLDWLKPF